MAAVAVVVGVGVEVGVGVVVAVGVAVVAVVELDKLIRDGRIRESRQGKVQADVKLDSAILSIECKVARLNRES